MDFVEKQAVHFGYRALWTQRTQLTMLSRYTFSVSFSARGKFTFDRSIGEFTGIYQILI